MCTCTVLTDCVCIGVCERPEGFECAYAPFPVQEELRHSFPKDSTLIGLQPRKTKAPSGLDPSMSVE